MRSKGRKINYSLSRKINYSLIRVATEEGEERFQKGDDGFTDLCFFINQVQETDKGYSPPRENWRSLQLLLGLGLGYSQEFFYHPQFLFFLPESDYMLFHQTLEKRKLLFLGRQEHNLDKIKLPTFDFLRSYWNLERLLFYKKNSKKRLFGKIAQIYKKAIRKNGLANTNAHFSGEVAPSSVFCILELSFL